MVRTVCIVIAAAMLLSLGHSCDLRGGFDAFGPVLIRNGPRFPDACGQVRGPSMWEMDVGTWKNLMDCAGAVDGSMSE